MKKVDKEQRKHIIMEKEFRQNENYETIKKGYVSPTVDVQESDGKGNRYSLPYGLCKGEGIDTTGMTPREAWDAYTNKTGISKEQAEKEHWGKEEDAQNEEEKHENKTEDSVLKEKISDALKSQGFSFESIEVTEGGRTIPAFKFVSRDNQDLAYRLLADNFGNRYIYNYRDYLAVDTETHDAIKERMDAEKEKYVKDALDSGKYEGTNKEVADKIFQDSPYSIHSAEQIGDIVNKNRQESKSVQENGKERRKFNSTLQQINEDAARRSQEATSFSDYKAGSATAGYNSDVARFDANVNALIEKYKDNDTLTDNDWERVYALADKYAANRASFTNEYNRINSSYPSWFIAGPANYNTRKHEKKMNAIDNVMRNQGANINPDKNEYLTKIKAILSNQNIKSDDSNAVGKLQAKYDGLKAELERGKEMNAYFRKNKTLVGFPGISEKTAKDFDERNKSGDIFASQPFASYRLQNGNAELRRIQQRIDSLNKIKESAETGGDASANYPKASGVSVEENAEQMRVQLRFDGKPDEETRTMLKSWGFRWSPSQGAWQRQLTGNGKYAAKQVMQKLSEKGE